MRTPIPGYRYFECEECGTDWRTATRDHQSPSGEHCPNCDNPNTMSPMDSVAVELPVDNHGNLVGSYAPEILSAQDDPSVIAVLPVGDSFVAMEAKHDIRLGDALVRNADGTVSPFQHETKTIPMNEEMVMASMRRNAEHFIKEATRSISNIDKKSIEESLQQIVSGYFTSVMGVLTPPLTYKTELNEETNILSFEVISDLSDTRYTPRQFHKAREAGLFPSHMNTQTPEISYLEYHLSQVFAEDGFCPIVYDEGQKIKIELVCNPDLKAVNDWNPGVVSSPDYFKFAMSIPSQYESRDNELFDKAVVTAINKFSEVFRKRHNRYPKVVTQLSNGKTEIHLS